MPDRRQRTNEVRLVSRLCPFGTVQIRPVVVPDLGRRYERAFRYKPGCKNLAIPGL